MWRGIKAKVREPLVRVGLGLSAMGAGAVLFWPDPVPPFSPEKALAFAAAVGVWLFAELFSENKSGPERGLVPVPLLPHDLKLGEKIYRIAGDDHLRFLREHDFGGSWRKESLDPSYELSYFVRNATSEFDDAELDQKLKDVRALASTFTSKLALGAWPIKGTGIFSMIPDRERELDDWSERTNSRVEEANDLADKLAASLEELYRTLRKKGANLIAIQDTESLGVDAA